MSDHITSCVNCHGNVSDDGAVYCSDACKHENESPRKSTFPPSPRAREIQQEIEQLVERDGEVKIALGVQE